MKSDTSGKPGVWGSVSRASYCCIAASKHSMHAWGKIGTGSQFGCSAWSGVGGGGSYHNVQKTVLCQSEKEEPQRICLMKKNCINVYVSISIHICLFLFILRN